MSSDNTSSSTVKAYVDQAAGYVQNVVGTLTGNTNTETKGQANQDQGKLEHDASHTTAKVGPITADPNTGAAVKDDPNRTSGSWDQTVGSAKESLGNLIGNETLRREGAQQNAQGKEKEAQGQLKDWGQGVADRAQGALGSVGAAVLGDRQGEEKWRDVHDEGKTRQRGAEADMEKKGPY